MIASPAVDAAVEKFAVEWEGAFGRRGL